MWFAKEIARQPVSRPVFRAAREARTQAGFTLVEVLVALAIVSVALAAASRAVANLTENHGQLRDRSLAQLSAENRLAEMRLEGATIRPGTQRSDCPQGQLVLVCLTRVTVLPSGLREVSIDVVRKEKPVPPVLSMTQVLGGSAGPGDGR